MIPSLLKKLLAICLFTAAGYNAFAQAPAIEWQQTYGGTNGEAAFDIKCTNDAGYVILGSTQSTNGDVTGNHGQLDYWVVKIKSNGSLQWQKALGGTSNDNGHSIQQTSDGGYIVAGDSDSFNGNVTGNHGSADFWVVKLDSFGTIQWEKSFGGSNEDIAYYVQQTADAGYVVAGSTLSNDGDVTNNNGGSDYWVVKLDTEGNIQWQKTLGGTGYDSGYSLRQTPDGGYVMAGVTLSFGGNVAPGNGLAEFWVVKINSTGTVEWQNTYGGTQDENAYSIDLTSDGGYIVSGTTRSNNGDVSGSHGADFDDYWVLKLSSTGAIQWQKCLGGSNQDMPKDMHQTADGGYIVTGFSSSVNDDVTGNHGSMDYWAVKLSSTGTLQWQKALGGSSGDIATCITQTPDGGYITAGSTQSNNGDITNLTGISNIWVVKLAPETAGVAGQFKNTFTLYPNPNNGTFTIGSNMPLANVILKVYSALGQLVYNGQITTATVTIPNIAAGIYNVQISSGSQLYSQKLVIE